MEYKIYSNCYVNKQKFKPKNRDNYPASLLLDYTGLPTKLLIQCFKINKNKNIPMHDKATH